MSKAIDAKIPQSPQTGSIFPNIIAAGKNKCNKIPGDNIENKIIKNLLNIDKGYSFIENIML